LNYLFHIGNIWNIFQTTHEQRDAMTPQSETSSERYPWYVVVVLLLAAVVSFVDRQLLSLLVEPIKRDLQISDTQIGLLQGLAFSTFYAIAGVSIGRFVDSGNRRNLIAAGIALWTAATAACGLSRTYVELFLARMAVGVGEAVLGPAAYSMIGDYFERHRVPLALGVFSIGVSLGAGLAFVIGGFAAGLAARGDVVMPLLGNIKGWQAAFIVVGLPGMLIAVLMFTVREPLRRNRSTHHASVPLKVVATFLATNRRLACSYLIGIGLLTAFSYGSLAWVPTYFVRVHALSAQQVGAIVGGMILVLSTLGIFSGGWIASRLARRGRTDATLRTGMWAAALCLPFGVLAPLMPTPTLSMLMFGPSFLFGSVYVALGPAMIQMITPNEMRGQLAALSLMMTNLLGGVIGPAAVAFATDHIFGKTTDVGYSLALLAGITCTLGVISLSISLPALRSADLAAQRWLTPSTKPI
jgi:MFS family permease